MKHEATKIYYEGNTDLVDRSNNFLYLGIVGSRKILNNTKYILEDLFEELSLYPNIVVLSGGMYGVDLFVHNLSLKHNLGTILFLPSGIDVFKKSALYKLLNLKLTSNYLLYSQFENSFSPRRYTFLKRNKQLVNFSDIVLVAQSSLNSGSSFSGNYSLSINKRTFCVPFSPIDIQFQGNNFLISNGANIYLNPKDFIAKIVNRKSKILELEEILKFLPSNKDDLLKNFCNDDISLVEKTLLESILKGEIFYRNGEYIKNNDKSY